MLVKATDGQNWNSYTMVLEILPDARKIDDTCYTESGDEAFRAYARELKNLGRANRAAASECLISRFVKKEY